jgi:hypothetical protein
MPLGAYRLSYHECRDLLVRRLDEGAPGRIQLLSGPRQVGKTTLLLELEEQLGNQAVYGAADSPEAALPGFLDRLLSRAEDLAGAQGRAIVLLDEVHLLHNWAARLKSFHDRVRRHRIPIHIIATGSSALHIATGSRESLAGRFERLTLTHWSAASLAQVFKIEARRAADLAVLRGTYPGAYSLLEDERRWSAYVRDAILEPAIGRDIVAMAAIRRPALLRQVFGVSAASPAQIVSLQKIQGQIQDAAAIETVAHYLALLEEAFLVAALPKYSTRGARRRAAPPKLVTLNNALLAATDHRGAPDPGQDPSRYGSWVQNACLASAWNAGQSVSYWREEPLEIDGVVEGSWGAWAIEVKPGRVELADLRGLLEFVRRHPRFRPLLVCGQERSRIVDRAGVTAITWPEFLLKGAPSSGQPVGSP